MKLLSIITAAMLATTAHADGLTDLGLDDPHVAPPAPTPISFYAGLGAGASMIDNSYGLDYRGDVEDVAFDLDGEAYSAFAGVRYTFASGLVIGGEIQHTEISAGQTVDCHGVCQLCSVDQGGILDATLTVGYTAGRFMVYGLAGVAQTTGSFDLANPDGTSIAGEGYDTDGTVFGAGIEYALTEHWSIGAEYNAFDFGGATGETKHYDISSETDLETVQLRAVFTF